MSSIAAFIYGVYMTLFWRPDPSYNATIMFYTGWYDNTWLPVVSVAVLFNTIEKSIMIKFTYHYGERFKRIVHCSGIITSWAMLVINGAYFLLNMQYPENSGINVFICMCKIEKRYAFWVIKTVFAALNVLVGVYFFYLLKTMPQESESSKKNNKLALQTVL
uniref:7TM GPCR serpentine receptor class x (Srx) domain-containing protein n=1 Tax=Acrobeloides nanus TaxID=290746 RepID=A0A914EEF8_9BILA